MKPPRLRWTMFVINKTGSARKLGEEIESALREHMDATVRELSLIITP